MKKAIIYCRVSTTEQAKEGLSLPRQEKLCRQYAKQNGYEVLDVYVERGESAKTVDRTELQNMMKYCKLNENEVDAVIIYKIDRLSRDSYDYAGLKAFFATCGIKIVSTTEPIEDNPIGRFIEGTLANVAQLDNEIRAERSVGGMKEALLQGRYIFPAPIGYDKIKGRGKSNITPDKKLAPKVKKVFQMIYDGYHTLEEIRQKAKGFGLTKPNGKPLGKSHFYKMIRKPVYKGYIEVPSMGVYEKGNFKAIVEPELFDAVQNILDGKNNKVPKYKKLNPDFPLRGTIKCDCGKYMTSNWSKGNGGKYGYYRCTKCSSMNLSKKDTEDVFYEYLQTVNIKENHIELIKLAIDLNWEERNKELSKKLNHLDKIKLKHKEAQKVIVKRISTAFIVTSLLRLC